MTRAQILPFERISLFDANADDGRIYNGFVERAVLDHNGNLAIPRGSNVELVVRRISKNEVTLDLDSVMINGERYGVRGEDLVGAQNESGIGANKRTGEYLGGGAVLGAIIGAIAGGGKGAAIGAAEAVPRQRRSGFHSRKKY